MRKYKDVAKRIIGLLLAVCMVTGMMPAIPARAADAFEVKLWTDESRTSLVDGNTYAYTGEEFQPYVEVIDNSTGEALPADAYVVQYSANRNAGEATVSVMGSGAYDFSLEKKFTINAAYIDNIRLTYKDVESGVPYCFYDSAGARPEILKVEGEMLGTGSYVELQKGQDYEISYNNHMDACVDLSASNPNRPNFVITLKNNYQYAIGTSDKVGYYRIYYNMEHVVIDNIPNETYTGKPHTPAYHVTFTDKPALAPQFDVRVDNSIEAGTATLVLVGKDKFRGTARKDFVIDKANASALTVEFDQASYDYTGSVIPMENHIKVMLGDVEIGPDNYDLVYSTQGILGNNVLTLKGKKNIIGDTVAQYKVINTIADYELQKEELSYTGSKNVPVLTVKDTAGNPVAASYYKVTYYEAPTAEGEDPYGEDRKIDAPTAVGTYYIKIEGTGFLKGSLGTVDQPISYRIVPKQIGTAKFKLDNNYVDSSTPLSVFYDGSSKWTNIHNLVIEDNGTTLTAGQDYTVKYYKDEACAQELTSSGQCVNAGTYYIEVTGSNSYEGSRYVLQYVISPRGVRPVVTVKPQSYTGGAITPPKADITVTAPGVTGEITDYIISSCTENVNIGTANITIELTGNYIGTAKGTFEIVPKKISDCTISTSSMTVTYNGRIQKPSITVKDGIRPLTENVEYSVKYYSQPTCNPSEEIEGQKDVGTCWVVVSGLGYYANSEGTTRLVFAVTPKPLTSSGITFQAANRPYTGSPVEPELTVKDGQTPLTENDYEVVGYFKDEACTTASDRVSGKVYVKIKGKGNYSAQAEHDIVTYFYIGNDIADLAESIGVTEALVYNRASQYQKILDNLKVYDMAGEVIAPEKYTVHFYADKEHTREITAVDNLLFVNAGTVYIGIEGRNGYYGMFYGACVIERRSISGMQWSVGGTYTYTGSDIFLVINDGTDLTKTDGVFLVYPATDGSGDDYTLTAADYKIAKYDGNRNAGTATVTLSGQGNYTGTQTILFTIGKKSLNDLANLSVAIRGATYTSRKQIPSVTITYGDDRKALAADTDFTMEYYTDASYTVPATDADLINAGTVYVKITGANNFKDTLTTDRLMGTNQYVIAPRDIRETVVSLEGQTYVYSDIPTESKIPVFTVRFQYATGSYYTLAAGSDYVYTPDTKGYSIGEQTLDIMAVANGNFTGDKEIKYYHRGNMKNSADEIRVEGITSSIEYTTSVGQIGAQFSNIVVYNKETGEVIDPSCYTVDYVANKSVGTATVKIIGKESKYWTGTYTQDFKITGSITDTQVVIPDQVYTGDAYTADTLRDIQVTCHGYTLEMGRDYKITKIDNGTNAALATAGPATAPTVTLQGIGDFFPSTTETQKVNFSIKYDISSENLQISEIPPQIYTGSTLEPVVNVEYSKPDGTKAVLTRGEDFEVTYFNNTNVAGADGIRGPYAVVTAKEDGLLLPGSRTVPFSIGKVDLEDDSYGYHITGIESEYLYTGAAIRPKVTVEDADGNILDPNNYIAVCESPIWEANTTVTITVNGKGNYYGTLTTSFKIVTRSLANADDEVQAAIGDLVYNGKEQRPTFKVTFEDYNLNSEGKGKTQTLKEGIDYIIVDYYNNRDAGEAGSDYSYENGPYVKIQAVPGRSIVGERVIPFTIKPKEMDDLYYTRIEDPTYETGKDQYRPPVSVKISAGSEEELTEGFDYTLEYNHNDKAASANETIGPYLEVKAYSHNFTGSHIIPFSILQRDINGEEFKIELQETAGGLFDDKKWNYPNPGTYTPKVILSDCTDPENPIALQEVTDFQPAYSGNNAVGTATITITARGNYTGVRYVKFTIGTLFDWTNVSVTQGNSPVTDGFLDVTYNGKSQVPLDVMVKRIVEPVAELAEGTDYAVHYYTDEECTKPILAENVINAGTYYMKLEGLTTAGYIGSIVIPFRIRQKSLNSSDIKVKEIEPQKFAGGDVRPGVTMYDTSVTTSEGEYAEIPASGYDVTYFENDSIGSARAVVTANENGNYTGTREVHFNIIRQDIKEAIVYELPDYEYTGSAILPDPVIYFNSRRLVKGIDYKLMPDPNYGDNIKAGIAWVVIQGIGNYTGVKEASFRIKANLENATVSEVGNQVYTGSEIRPLVQVICGGNLLTAGKEYTITYDHNTDIGDAYMILEPTQEYSHLYTGSYVVKFNICNTLERADIRGIPTSQTYTGGQITPEPEVWIGNTRLLKGRDYSVQWNNAVNVGRATVTVTGMGRYAGSKSKSYNIIAKSITRCSVNSIADISYDGKRHTPEIIVRDGGRILARNVDYRISYGSNTKIGTGTVTITGMGNYSGARKEKFSIVSAPITGLKFSSTMTSVKLSWSKKKYISGYQVYTSNGRTRIAQTKKNSITIKKLKAGAPYKYKVRTYTKIGKKTYYGAFKTISVATKPSAPSISVKSAKRQQVKISWKRVTGATGYEIYASATQAGGYKKIALILKGSTVSYTSKRLRSGEIYYYKVRAYRTVDGRKVYGSYSNIKSARVK